MVRKVKNILMKNGRSHTLGVWDTSSFKNGRIGGFFNGNGARPILYKYIKLIFK